jgi:hypothetical protein
MLGNPTYVPSIRSRWWGQRAVPDMPRKSAQFEPVAWWWTRHEIGRDLRKRYDVSKDLPPEFLTLVRKLDDSDLCVALEALANGRAKRLIPGRFFARSLPVI